MGTPQIGLPSKSSVMHRSQDRGVLNDEEFTKSNTADDQSIVRPIYRHTGYLMRLHNLMLSFLRLVQPVFSVEHGFKLHASKDAHRSEQVVISL